MKKILVAAAYLFLVMGREGFGKGADRPELANLDFRQVIKQAKDKVFPAVVFIKCIRENYEEGKKASQEVAGSGVIISEKGEVLTNWHVVDKAEEVRCLLSDGRPMEAKVLGTDKDTDLALLKLQVPAGSRPAPRAELGDSSLLKEGDFVMAMGAPWGLTRSVSIGIISCTDRFLATASEYSLWLQTDASICPGNSGGPLVNTEGKVIGINTRGALFGGDLGFSIPSNTIKIIVPKLRQFGRVNWSWTGVQLQALKDFERNIYFDETEGVIVTGTDPESPARLAGLLPKDRIIKINGRLVTATTEEDLPGVRREIGLLAKGKPAKFDLVRDDKPLTLLLTPCEKGKVEGEDFDCPRWDLTVKTINQFDNPDLFFQAKKGVFIQSVKRPGNAEEAHLQVNDILLKIDGREVTTLDDVRKIHKASLKAVEEKPRLIFTVLRNGLLRQVVLDISRDYERE